jgi:enamine deaminase RidA (YjgF/YER057c/UK114 family)
MPNIQFLNPDTLGRPIAPYSNITRVKASEFLFIAGQVGMDKSGKTPADFEGQCAQVFANIGAALASQGAVFPNIVEFTSYLVHSQDIGKFVEYRAREYPRRLSDQHAAHRRPLGARGVFDRGERGRRVVGFHQRGQP